MSGDPELERRPIAEDALRELARLAGEIFDDRVVVAYLYGSAARGEAARDLDVALVASELLPHAVIERWAAELQRRAMPRGPELDVRQIDRAAPRFRATVVREGRVLVERDLHARREFERNALREWLDFRPTWEHMRRRMLDRLSHG